MKTKKKSKRKYKNPYISNSVIHGKGIFSHKKYKKNDIIFKDVFPHFKKEQDYENMFLFFTKYILHKCKHINHCKKNKNTTIIQRDNKYILIATKNINKNKEIFLNYDELNRRFPFIKKSDKNFTKC